jgi:MipA family protein
LKTSAYRHICKRPALHRVISFVACLALAWLTLGMGGLAFAQSAQPGYKSDWQFSAGAGIVVAPKYLGAEDSRARAIPFLEAKYQDWLTINPINGIEMKTDLGAGFSVGGSIGADLTRRRAKDDERFQGLTDIKESPVGRVFADYSTNDFSINAAAKYRAGKSEGRGTILEIDAGYNLLANSSGALTVGVSISAMDSTYATNFFGISAEQSRSSGLRQFNAKSGLRDAGVYVQGVYKVTPRWMLIGRVKAAELGADVADSPVVRKESQISALALFAYAF